MKTTCKYSKLKEAEEATCKRKGNVFSRVSVSWLDETIERAKDGTLDEHTLAEVPDMKSSEETTDRLEYEWKREVKRASAAGNRPRLWKAVVRSVDLNVFIRTCVCGILDSTGRILQAVSLSFILSELALGSRASMVALCLYATSMTFFFLVEHMCRNEQYHYGILTAVHVRAALTGLIQRKVGNKNKEKIDLGSPGLSPIHPVPFNVFQKAIFQWHH